MSQITPTSSRSVDCAGAGGAEPSMRSRAVYSSVWIIAGFGAAQAIRLGGSLITTRLLNRDAFGLMAFVWTFITGLHMFSDVGIRPAIIQSHRDDEDFLNAAWTVQVIRGVTLAVCACLLAWPVARYYHQPELAKLIPVAGLTAIIDGFSSTSFLVLNRRMAVGKRTLLELASQILALIVMVVLAWHWPSVWVLVAGSLVSTVCSMAVSHFALPGHRNRFRWDPQVVGALFTFGRWIFLSTLLTFLSTQGDRLIFGKMIPLAALGTYSLAVMISGLPFQVVMALGTSVLFPGLSSSQRRSGNITEPYRNSSDILGLICGAAVIGMVLLAPGLVRALYDKRYSDIGWITRLLAGGVWFATLETLAANVCLVVGQTKWLAAAGTARTLWLFTAVPIAYHWGFPVAVGAVAVADVPRYLVSAWGARRNGQIVFARDMVRTAKLAVAVGAALVLELLLGPGGSLVRAAALTLMSLLIWTGLNYQSLLRGVTYIFANTNPGAIAEPAAP